MALDCRSRMHGPRLQFKVRTATQRRVCGSRTLICMQKCGSSVDVHRSCVEQRARRRNAAAAVPPAATLCVLQHVPSRMQRGGRTARRRWARTSGWPCRCRARSGAPPRGPPRSSGCGAASGSAPTGPGCSRRRRPPVLRECDSLEDATEQGKSGLQPYCGALRPLKVCRRVSGTCEHLQPSMGLHQTDPASRTHGRAVTTFQDVLMARRPGETQAGDEPAHGERLADRVGVAKPPHFRVCPARDGEIDTLRQCPQPCAPTGCLRCTMSACQAQAPPCQYVQLLG